MNIVGDLDHDDRERDGEPSYSSKKWDWSEQSKRTWQNCSKKNFIFLIYSDIWTDLKNKSIQSLSCLFLKKYETYVWFYVWYFFYFVRNIWFAHQNNEWILDSADIHNFQC